MKHITAMSPSSARSLAQHQHEIPPSYGAREKKTRSRKSPMTTDKKFSHRQKESGRGKRKKTKFKSQSSVPIPSITCFPTPTLPQRKIPPQKALPELLHLTAHRNSDLLRRPLVAGAHVLDLAHDVHALDHSTEDDVLAVEVRRGRGQDEELAAVGVGAGVLFRREA